MMNLILPALLVTRGACWAPLSASMGGEDRKDAMYIPQFNHVTDPAILHALMQHFSFATLVTQHEGRPFATHLPFLVEPEHGEQGRLLAHLAKANPQWTDFGPGREALVIFQGPHTYISPSWYETQPSVPTWNYAVVHAYGARRIQTCCGDGHRETCSVLSRAEVQAFLLYWCRHWQRIAIASPAR
jgi:predicted FMN-binding regulatory protein PaiB